MNALYAILRWIIESLRGVLTTRTRATTVRVTFGAILLVTLITGTALYAVHVANATSGYKLPYPGGTTWEVTQGNNQGDHVGTEAWAFDFGMTSGSTVVAARGGTVTFVNQSSNTNCWPDNGCINNVNYVVINHGDGTQALYLHLQYQGVLVSYNQVVAQGQPIAYSDNTGWSSGPHLHFMVEHYSSSTWYTTSIPISFDDVSSNGGVPVTYQSYTSGNYYNGGGCANAPGLNSPGDNATLNNRSVSFSWSPPSNCSPDGYTFRINTSSDPEAGPFIVDTGVGGTSYNYNFGSDGTYHWHVRDCKPCTPYNPGAWSNRTFTINTITGNGCSSAPTLNSPGDGATLNNRSVSFNWSPPSNCSPDGYTFRINTSSDPEASPFIVDTGVGGTSYNYTFGSDGTYYWHVRDCKPCTPYSPGAWSNRTFTINTTPTDTTPPTVQWTVPVTNGGIYHCQSGAVQLEASASDNVGVQRVDFYRYDSVHNTWPSIGSDTSSPYQASVDCGTLNFDWNQTNVTAYDTSGNASTDNTFIWLFRDHTPSAPSNLNAQASACNQVSLTWNDNSDNEAGFKIYRNGTYIGQVGANSTSYQDTGVSESSSYSYTVTAFVGTLESSASNSASVNTPACAQPPSNDDFGSATAISGMPYNDTLDTSAATVANDDPSSCGSGVNSHSVWYRYTAPSNRAIVTLDTEGSDYDTVLAVWTGTRGSLALVACNDDARNDLTSHVAFTPATGTTYYVEVMRYSTGATGTLHLAVTPASPAATIGVSRPANALFFLRNSNSSGYADTTVLFGPAGATPLMGDWTGKGYDSVGAYNPGSRVFYMRNSNTGGNADIAFAFGPNGCAPLIGDWTGKGYGSIGVYCNGVFYLRNSNSGGNADIAFAYGPASGCQPVVGDWTGKGYDSVGVYCHGVFYLRNSNNSGNADIAFAYGPASGCQPVVGDWTGKGYESAGLDCGGVFYLRNSNSGGNADTAFLFGGSSDRPLAGTWKTVQSSMAALGSSSTHSSKRPHSTPNAIPRPPEALRPPSRNRD